ncbi:MAG TPA: protein kinase, partial [Solirubrobacteraceae bacterium]|nr:protein kinase [Solirubrobacteraceae bacterium]
VAKLTDFGGARLAGEAALTRTGDVLGTLAYMAPEQCEGAEAGEAADLYSLTLVLYEALCGSNPVRARNPAATARRIGTVLPPLERSRPGLPRELTRALDMALAPDPEDRGTLEDLRLALEAALERGLRRRRFTRRRPPRATPAPEPRERPREGPPEESPIAVPRRPGLPREAWLAGTAFLMAWQIAVGRAGLALVLVLTAAPLLVPRRVPVRSLGAALAPALGLVGLAGAYPALAGQAARWYERAWLGAVGYWWLALAGPALDREVWLKLPARTPPGTIWEPSLGSAILRILAPQLTLAVLLGMALWAMGALALPWIVRGRHAALDVVAATVWSAALAGAVRPLYGTLTAGAQQSAPRGAVLGAVLGGAIAVSARAFRGPV